MKVSLDEKTGCVVIVFTPSHRSEANQVLEFAVKLYRGEEYDVSEIVSLQMQLKETVFTIQ